MGARGTDVARTEATAQSRRPRLPVAATFDRGFAGLRRAARAALLIPPVFAFYTLVLHGGQHVIFAVFGCFALLVMSDSGGQRPARALAYLTATLAGAVLVTIGTLASASAGLAAAVMFVVGFAIAFSRVFGGYVAAAQTGMLLSFVVAVSIPAPASAIPARVEGWVVAGIISTLAGIVLWPRFERVRLRKQAAKACLAIPNLVEALRSNERELPRLLAAAREAERATRQAYTATAKRPAGPTRRDRAFVQLLTELQRVVDIIERPFQQSRVSVRPDIVESDRLATATVSALRGSADVLTGGAAPDLRAGDEAPRLHRAPLDRSGAATSGGVGTTPRARRRRAVGPCRPGPVPMIVTVWGVVTGAVSAHPADTPPVVMWAALPVVALAAASPPTAVGFAASQAAFTIN